MIIRNELSFKEVTLPNDMKSHQLLKCYKDKFDGPKNSINLNIKIHYSKSYRQEKFLTF